MGSHRGGLGLVLLLSVLALFLVAGTEKAYACSCAVGQPAEQVARANTVFTGTAGKVVHHVEDRIGDPDGPALPSGLPEPAQSFLRQGRPIYRSDKLEVKFALDKSYKGAAESPTTVWASAGEMGCGFDFQEGVRYTVFANQLGGRLTTGLCSGTQVGPINATSFGLTAKPISTRPTEATFQVIPVLALGVGVLAVFALALWTNRMKRQKRPRLS
jgi:hypothetical protein